MILMNAELTQITLTAAQAETDYQEANTRFADARRAVYALEDEIAKMTGNPDTKPAELSKKVADLNARKMMLPAPEAAAMTAHQRMMHTRQSITDYNRMLEGKRQRAAALENEMRNMQRHITQLESTLNGSRFALESMQNELAGINALLAD